MDRPTQRAAATVQANHNLNAMTLLSELDKDSEGLPRGFGEFIKESRPCGRIASLVLRGSVDVVYRRTDAPELIIAGETKEAIEAIETRSKGDRLTVGDSGGGLSISVNGGTVSIAGGGGAVQIVQVGRGHTIIQTSGGSTVSSGAGRAVVCIGLPELRRIEAQGSSDIDMGGVNQDALVIEVSGSCDVTARGSVQLLEVQVSGSGDVDARELIASTARLSVSGSGDVRAHATNNARVRVSGSGDVKVYGNPLERDHRVSGSGVVKFPKS